MIWYWTRRLTWRSTRRLTRRWPALSTSRWFRSFGYLWGKCWQIQMLSKNVLMPEEFEGPHGYYILEKSLLFCILNWGKWVRWLVINEVHICYIRKDRGTKKTSTWECSGRRRLGCEFKMRTTKPEGPGALTIIQMSDPEIHLCSADKVAPLHAMHWCKSFVCRWQKGWRKIWMLSGRRFGMGNVYWNIV